jgi:protein-S-isoprenylcysteine O-methyltransferase Ste14
MYVGLLLVYAGVSCWLGFVWPLLLVPILIWVIAAGVIAREERYLERKFGHEYRSYQTRVRRWL